MIVVPTTSGRKRDRLPMAAVKWTIILDRLMRPHEGDCVAMIERGDARAFALGRELLAQAEPA
jgi:hypothetical protein